MPSTINASNSGFGGIVSTGDSSGELQLQTAGTTAVTIDTSQKVAFVAGTAAAPAITTVGDTNTGMFFPAADTIAFSEGGVESMRIDSGGNLLVGDTVQSGSSKLTLKQSVDATNGGLAFVATDGSGAVISRLTDGGFTFRNGGLERMRILSGGSVCVNNTTSPGGQTLYVRAFTGVGAAGFQVWQNASGAIDWYNASATYVASVIVNASSVAYNTTSDYRLKEDIIPMTGALDKVAKLKPVSWKWKTDGSEGQGFIAHELAEVVPDCVSGEKDAVDAEGNPKYQGVDTSFLVATLTAAIQEQQTIINDLKARIEILEAK